ncbi:VanW family protein [Planococcus beigongshangi]|uniref:VanW family protein n=1 Tax=Planococcus beigongshangi TaxID=2782536 RepID=UPI00193BB8B1|nr:VanW family protein [Planococcus beigongshangi]
MDNQIFGKSLLTIASSALLVFGVANAGSLAADKWLFPAEEFGSNTYIGTTDVSNMELSEARLLFAGKVDSWRSTAELQVTYQDVTASYPLDNAEILLDETVANAETGTQNNYIFKLSEDTTRTFLSRQFPVADFSPEDITAINQKLELALQSGQALSRVSISDDTLGVSYETVAETTWNHSFNSAGATDIVNALSNYKLEAGAQFSFLDFINEMQPADVTDEDLSQIASSLYASVLKTNFLVDERSIGSAIPTTVPLGQEATINRKLGIDFVFTNINASSFNLQMSVEGPQLISKIAGMPFVHTYEIMTGGEQELEPRLIRQFSAFVASGRVVEEQGSDGVIVEVTRSIRSDDFELEVESVSTDFYPPVHRVEVYPLAKPEAATGTTNPDGTITNPDGTITNPDGTVKNPDGTITKPDGTVTTPVQPPVTPPNSTPTDPDDQTPVIDSDLDGIPDNEEKKPVYDKGGKNIDA